MKKRLIALVLCAGFLLALGLRGPEMARPENGYDLYFREADLSAVPGGDALRAERLYIDEEEQLDTPALAVRLMEALLAGPEDPALVNAIPEETELLSLELEDGQVRVDLSWTGTPLTVSLMV